ncbi:MAG: MFS transporter [Bacteroidales bacterium]
MENHVLLVFHLPIRFDFEWMKHETPLPKSLTFFSLYIAQSIPMSLFSTLLPVLMRQEQFSLTSIGLLQLIKLPWIVKFLWAPLVDRKTTHLASYKRWIVLSEVVYAFFMLMLAFLNLQMHFLLIVVLIVLSLVASATQDIATDALTTLSFSRTDRSKGNSIQSMGHFTGSLVGGGLLLVLYPYMGWLAMMLSLSAFVLLMLLPLLRYKDDTFTSKPGRSPIQMRDLLLFFTQKGIGMQLLFLFLFNSGLIGILSMLKPWLVDLKYPMAEIGLMFSVFGSFCGLVGSFVSGRVLRRLGRSKGAVVYAGLLSLVVGYFVWISYTGYLNTYSLSLGIALLWFTYGLSTVLVYTLAMDFVREGREGTDFTLQIVLLHISSMLVAIGSGRLADVFGYTALFAAEGVLALISFAFVVLFVRKRVYAHVQ